MAERLPMGTAKTAPPFGMSSSIPPSDDKSKSTAAVEQVSSTVSCHEPDDTESNGLVMPEPSSADANSIPKNTEQTLEATARNKSKAAKVESAHSDQWVEQDEPGVYITFVSLPGGIRDLRRVRFSRKRFTEKQAEQWWAANRSRVYQQYKIPMADKSSSVFGREMLAH